jgi:hypothetical protein
MSTTIKDILMSENVQLDQENENEILPGWIMMEADSKKRGGNITVKTNETFFENKKRKSINMDANLLYYKMKMDEEAYLNSINMESSIIEFKEYMVNYNDPNTYEYDYCVPFKQETSLSKIDELNNNYTPNNYYRKMFENYQEESENEEEYENEMYHV